MADSFNIAPTDLSDQVSLKRVLNQIISKVQTLETKIETLQSLSNDIKSITQKLSDLEERVTKLENI